MKRQALEDRLRQLSVSQDLTVQEVQRLRALDCQSASEQDLFDCVVHWEVETLRRRDRERCATGEVVVEQVIAAPVLDVIDERGGATAAPHVAEFDETIEHEPMLANIGDCQSPSARSLR